jgi:light-regulated signal transduction histidine kinase (bacteriophytochrome)
VADPGSPRPPSTDWLGRLAHDLRNPITPMRSAVQLLQLGQLPPEVAPDLLRTLDRQLDVLLRLIDDVGDLVKVERGTFALRLATCDLGQVAAAAVAKHARATGQVEAAVDATGGPVWVLADEVRLRQAVEGLLACIDNPGAAGVEVVDELGSGVLRLSGSRSTVAEARLGFLAGGPVPDDPAILGLGHLVARKILEGHAAMVTIEDGSLALRVPRADPDA